MDEDELRNILRAADKHPNSRVAKLIRSVQDDPSHKNIVLLLIEIAEHNEYSIDFDISLQYYLNLFEQLGLNNSTILNEAGILLINAANIYVRRVDCIYDLIKQQLLSLSNADKELEERQKQNDESKAAEDRSKDTNKSLIKRSRKRALDAPINRDEIELVPKKVRKLAHEKRFALLDNQQNINKLQMKFNTYKRLYAQQYLHPTSWLQGTIYDLENDDEIDNKRNYKMFTYHVEHRYHTLVPDINFRLHFKMKDFIDEENERLELDEMNDMCHMVGRKWPPLSEAYIEQYIDLENRILGQTSYNDTNVQIAKQSSNLIDRSAIRDEESETSIARQEGIQEEQQQQQNQEQSQNESAITNVTSDASNASNNENHPNDSTISSSNVNTSGTFSEDCPSNNISKNKSEGYYSLENSTSVLEDTQLNDNGVDATVKNVTEDIDDTEIDLHQIRVRLPHLDDEGVYISDLDENDQKMLSPKVLATDVFPLIPHKENIRIIINDEIRAMFGIRDSPTKNFETSTVEPSIKLNIFKLPEKLLKKRVLFKLGSDMKVYMDARLSKRSRISNEATIRNNRQLQYFPLNNTDFTNVQITPLNSPGHCSDFYGFSLDGDMDIDMNMNNSDDEVDFLGFDDTASRDSGMGIEMNVTAADSQACEERVNLEYQNNPIIDSTNMENVNITVPHTENNNHHAIECEEGGNCDNEQINAGAELFDSVNREHSDEEQEAEQNETFNDLDLSANSSTKTKVQEWHDYLRPILAKSRERHHFDVFQLGTEIIETIQRKSNQENHCSNSNSDKNIEKRLSTTEIETDIEVDAETRTESNRATVTCNSMDSTTASTGPTAPTATFMNIVEDKDESCVSRYFLSTLLLINQGNLELIVDKKDNSNAKSGEQPIEWDEMMLKLKSTKRYSVAVEDNIGLVDKGADHKPKETIIDKTRPIIDRRMSYSKNVVLKRAHNNERNTIMNEHEICNNIRNNNENNGAKVSEAEVFISSTPIHKLNKCTNKSWEQLSRISNIMPLEDRNEYATATNSTHSHNITENSSNNNAEKEEQPCSSGSKLNQIKPMSIKLKKFIPLPTVTKSSRQHETDSGIFSNDNYHLIS